MVMRKSHLAGLKVPQYRLEDLPISEIGRKTGQGRIAKLSFNESPYGVSPKVGEAIRAVYEHEVSRYGDPYQRELVEALAEYTGVQTSQIVFGNGADELIDLICRTFVGPGDEVLIPLPIFGAYLVDPVISNAAVRTIAPNEGLEINLGQITEAIGEKTKIITLCNPNNPTGRLIPTAELVGWLRTVPEHILVVVDEAYAEYVDDFSFEPSWNFLAEFPNLIVIRTFSKVFGLASIRLGYGVANRPIVEAIEVCRKIANVNSFAAAAGVAALQDVAFIEEAIGKNNRERARVGEALTAMGCEVLPSQTNFLMVRFGTEAEKLWNHLKKQGIWTRMGWGLPDYIRISLGSPEENDWLLEEIASWKSQ
jgi:histidinol-phosphate aminotransferase